MLTRELITELKNKGNGDLGHLIDKQKDSGSIMFILENLGYLPKNFNGEFLLPLLKHEHPQVRLLAVKNIGKLSSESFLTELSQIIDNETNTSVKREVVSAIGRMRNPKNKEILYKILQDEDPKIVCQNKFQAKVSKMLFVKIKNEFIFKNYDELEAFFESVKKFGSLNMYCCVAGKNTLQRLFSINCYTLPNF